MESLTKASFGLLETLRVVLPGYYFSATAYLFMSVLGVSVGSLKEESLVSLILGLAVGFGLYSLNLPNKRRMYTRDQPSQHLQEFSQTLAKELGRPEIALSQFQALGRYLYILNNYFPQTFHEVVMVRGALWYCMTYFGFTSVFFGIVGSIIAFGHYVPCFGLERLTVDWHTICFVVAEIILAFLIFIPGRTDRMLQAVYKDQILWMDLNRRLLRYILAKGEDPKVNRLVSGDPIEGDQRAE